MEGICPVSRFFERYMSCCINVFMVRPVYVSCPGPSINRIIDKVYIDEPSAASTTLVGVLLSHFKRVSHVTQFYK